MSTSTCAISIVRIFTLRGAVNSTDPTWDNVPSSYWSIVELNTGILCASLPPLRPLFRHLFPGLSSRVPTYEERSGKGSSRARSSKARSVGPGVYALRDLESSASQEGLKDEDESWYHREPDYATHNATKGYQLRTNIQGGKAAGSAALNRGLPDLPAEAHEDGHRIMVTREIGFKEGSRKF